MLSTRPWLRCLALERRDRKNHCAFASSLGIPSAGQRRRISSVVQSPLCDVRLSVRKQFQNRRCQLFDSNGARNPTLAIARTFSSKENGSVSVAETEAEAVPAKTIASSEIQIETRARSGPPLQLRLANMALHAHSSVIATAGTTVILSTVSCGNDDEVDDELANESFLTVEYRQRTAAVGLIPGNRMRSDSYSSRLSNDEILASRCIDRALRPLLPERDPQTGKAVHFHIHTSVQAVDVWGTGASSSILSSSSGHPVATALNAASAALMEHLIEPVAATVLAVLSDGSIVQDPGPEQRNSVKQQNKDDAVYCVGELLYAGTRTHAVMMEWTSIHKSLPESQWPALLNVAAQSLHPILDSMEELRVQKQKRQEDKSESTTGTGNRSQRSFSVNDPEWSTAHLRKSLGLSPLPEDEGKADMTPDEMIPQSMDDRLNHRQELLSKLVKYCRDQLGRDPPNRLFGFRDEVNKDMETSPIYVHQDPTEILTKSHRGRLETIMHQEIARLVNEYLQRHAWLEGTSTDNENSDTIQDTYVPTILNNQVDQKWLHQKSVYRILRHALWETSARYGTRADGRRGGHLGQGWKTVRPVSLTVPALPDSVHGSALFARGDTQVLCTVTLGAPRDGQPPTNPYQPMHNPRQVLDGNDETDALPVGSLRFLRTQEALESDLNSRNSLADKERTGDSGNLAEVKRAFLQYDFPAYSTGEVPKKGGIDRRSVGHGALAERAILPLLPDPHDFPYSIRITSEVTDSNGSSSMASVCGATLALLDAGVPMKEPVAGVSVGLAVNHDHDTTNDGLDSEKYCLLMDITGTEDHYGAMDFKIAGTRRGVTAVQLDVKQPVPVDILVQGLNLAKSGRIGILDAMQRQSKLAFGGYFCRPEPKQSAPRVEVVRFDPQRKRDLVGPGGVILRQLEDRYGVSLDLTQEGQCLLFGANRDKVAKAKLTVMDLVADVVQGEIYTGTVIEIKDFGAIIELLRNTEGLLHVSEISTDDDEARRHPEGNVGFVSKYLKVGQQIEVLCIGVDPIQGSVKLSRKALLEQNKKTYSGASDV